MKDSRPLPSIDLDLRNKLQDREYRERFFLAEASAEIARQLIALRKRRQLSQAELAQRAKTQQPAVSRAERADYQNWSFNTLRKLTNAMDGRLTVKIEAWEDVVSEYCSDDQSPTVSQLPVLEAQPKALPRMRASAGAQDRLAAGLINLTEIESSKFNPARDATSLLDERSRLSSNHQGRLQ